MSFDAEVQSWLICPGRHREDVCLKSWGAGADQDMQYKGVTKGLTLLKDGFLCSYDVTE